MTASFDSPRVQCLGYRKEQSAARNAHLSSVDKVTACCDDAGGSPSWGTCHRCPCQGDNTRQSQLLSTSTAADRGPRGRCLCCRLACLFTERYVPVNLKNSCQAIALFTAPFILYACPRYSVHTSEVFCTHVRGILYTRPRSPVFELFTLSIAAPVIGVRLGVLEIKNNNRTHV